MATLLEGGKYSGILNNKLIIEISKLTFLKASGDDQIKPSTSYMCVCVVVPNGIFAIFNCKRTEFKDALCFVQRIMKRQY